MNKKINHSNKSVLPNCERTGKSGVVLHVPIKANCHAGHTLYLDLHTLAQYDIAQMSHKLGNVHRPNSGISRSCARTW